MRVNSIKDLRNFQKARRLSSHVTHLIVGKNIQALKLADVLRQKFGEAEVKLILAGQFSPHDLEFKGPSLIRGEDNIRALGLLYPELPLPAPVPVLFYKDQKLRPYGGRSQMLPMKEGEEFFTQPGLRLSLPEIWQQDFNELIARNRCIELNYQISSLHRVADERQRWLLKCKDGSEFSCTHLYYSNTPHSLVSLLDKSFDLSAELLEYLGHSEGKLSLEVEFHANKEITSHLETLLLPQSLTYEWGHFLGEFDPFDPAKNTQRFKFFAFTSEDEADHEELAKKVKLLKRNLERVFPQLEKTKISEVILLKNAPIAAQAQTDLIADKIKEELPSLILSGPHAPLSQNFLQQKKISFPSMLSHDVRALFSLEEIFSRL